MRDLVTWDYQKVGSVLNLDHVEVLDLNGEVLACFQKSDVSWIEIRV
jgi:hypothetical protein